MQKSIILILRGGLGNQMFQYAFAKNLAITTNSKLIIDTKSGFYFDIYKRKYELKHFNIQEKKANLFYIVTYNLFKLYFKITKIKYKNKCIIKPVANFLYDTSNVYNQNYIDYNNKKYLWIEGYWQSFLYFNKNINVINETFNFKYNLPLSNNSLQLASNMLNENSIAICLRFYEETTNSGAQSYTGVQKTYNEINNIINLASNNIDNPKFYVFTLFKKNVIDNLVFKNNIDVTFITTDNNFPNTIETFYLQTHCKHQIIMNSTYYWWGAFLSKKNHNNQSIYIDSNFLNQDIFYPTWIKY